MKKSAEQTSAAAPVRGPLTKALGLAALLLYAVLATVAQASSVLVSETTLVAGSDSTVFSFEAPGPGTVSIQLTNLDWPQALSSLSFMASTSNQLISSWSDPPTMQSGVLSFQVAGGGRYFTDVMAAAGGPLDLGAYSLCIRFTSPGSPVALPASGLLLLGGVGILTLIRRRLAGGRSGFPLAVQAAP